MSNLPPHHIVTETDDVAAARDRVAAVREAAGSGAGYYGSTYLADQRQEWPS